MRTALCIAVSTSFQLKQTIVDEEVRKVIQECEETAVALLEANMEPFEKIAKQLLEKESISGEEFMELLKLARCEKVKGW